MNLVTESLVRPGCRWVSRCSQLSPPRTTTCPCKRIYRTWPIILSTMIPLYTAVMETFTTVGYLWVSSSPISTTSLPSPGCLTSPCSCRSSKDLMWKEWLALFYPCKQDTHCLKNLTLWMTGQMLLTQSLTISSQNLFPRTKVVLLLYIPLSQRKPLCFMQLKMMILMLFL